MRGENSRNISPKQEKHQRNVMRGITEGITRGDLMDTNSVNTRILASRDDDDAGHDDERAVGKRAQKDNSTDSRVLASGSTDPQRAVGPEHQKDNSTNTRVLASRAHLASPEGQNNLNLNDQRAVGTEAYKVHSGRYWLFPDNEITGTKIKSLKDKDKLPDLDQHNGNLGPSRVVVPNADTSKDPIGLQEGFLTTPQNKAHKKHGNVDFHDPLLAVANHSHSIMFKDLPSSYRKSVLAHRKYLMDNPTPSGLNVTVTTKPYVEQMRLAILELYHMIIDSPEMSAEQIDAMVTADAKAKAKLGQKQAEPTPDTSYYFQNPGPEAGGGVPPTT